MKLKYIGKTRLIIYGLGEYGLDDEIEISKEESKNYLDTGLFEEMKSRKSAKRSAKKKKDEEKNDEVEMISWQEQDM